MKKKPSLMTTCFHLDKTSSRQFTFNVKITVKECCRPTALLSSNTLAAFFLCACTYSMNWQAASSWLAVASWVIGSASRSTSPGAPSSSLSSASSLLSLLDKASSAIVVPLCGESRASIPSRVRRCFVFGVSAQTEPTALLKFHPPHEDQPSSKQCPDFLHWFHLLHINNFPSV